MRKKWVSFFLFVETLSVWKPVLVFPLNFISFMNLSPQTTLVVKFSLYDFRLRHNPAHNNLFFRPLIYTRLVCFQSKRNKNFHSFEFTKHNMHFIKLFPTYSTEEKYQLMKNFQPWYR